MDARVHWPLKVIAFNADGIWRQRYDLSKQLQDLHIDVVLLCFQRHTSNPMRRSLFQIITFIGLTAPQAERAELPLQ
jgi:hypothetical protein